MLHMSSNECYITLLVAALPLSSENDRILLVRRLFFCFPVQIVYISNTPERMIENVES